MEERDGTVGDVECKEGDVVVAIEQLATDGQEVVHVTCRQSLRGAVAFPGFRLGSKTWRPMPCVPTYSLPSMKRADFTSAAPFHRG